MALVTWNKKDSVGVKELDDQHEALIKFLNQLHAASMAGKAHEVANPALPRLLKLVNEHFSAEEKLMVSIRFPGLAAHRSRHREIAEKLAEIAALGEKGDTAAYVQLLYFTRNILARHIHEEDQKYAQWMSAGSVRS
jgi:hemerythrin